MRIVITGGAGFIGSSFVHLCVERGYDVLVVDKFTYASDIKNLPGTLDVFDILIKDICDVTPSDLGEYDYLVNFAAESHVDNSIKDGRPFVRTNVEGTFNLLECARKNPKLKRFIQISTDEVYGDLELSMYGESETHDPMRPSSYYSSTKASADLLVESCGRTYGLPYLITRTCNNFGIRQHSEKFIPTLIRSIKEGNPVPIYGDGQQSREWIWVEDNVRTILDLMEQNPDENVHHIGSGYTIKNIDIVKMAGGACEFIEDRLGHDRKYRLHSDTKTTLTLEQYLKEQLDETSTNRT